jgi:hypothetical protein
MGAMRSILEYLLIDVSRGSIEMEIEIEGYLTTVAVQVLVVFALGCSLGIWVLMGYSQSQL